MGGWVGWLAGWLAGWMGGWLVAVVNWFRQFTDYMERLTGILQKLIDYFWGAFFGNRIFPEGRSEELPKMSLPAGQNLS